MRLALHWKILIALAAGLIAGIAANLFWTAGTWSALGVGDSAAFLKGRASDANAGAGLVAGAARAAALACELIGDVFIRCLKAIAVPIVLCSLIVGAAGLGDLRTLGRVGGKAVALFAGTTVFASVLGLLITSIFPPGGGITEAAREQFIARYSERTASLEGSVEKLDNVWSFFRNLFPTNVVDSLLRADMLQIILISLAVGIALTHLGKDRAAPVLSFFTGLGEVVTVLVNGLMAVAPIAVFCLIASVTSVLGFDVLAALAKYCVVVAVGLGLLLYVEYPLMLIVLGRISPGSVRKFFRAIAPAQLMALSTSSSSATLPVTMACVKEGLGVSQRVTSFVCPLGATINMDGTAMYQAMATMFIAQMAGIDLTLGQQATVLLLTTLASVGAPGIPSGGIVLLIAVLGQVGVPPQGVAVVLAVDALLDRLRTAVNVSGDAMTALIIARSEGEKPMVVEP